MKTWVTQTLNLGMILLATVMSTARGDTPRSSRVGAVEYVDGSTFVNGKAISGGKEGLPVLDNGQSLSTGDGRAEMLLTPGIFLRLDAQSQVRLLDASLTDTRLHLDRGAAMLEVNDLHKDNRIRVETGSGSVLVLKTGLYRFQAEPAKVGVLKGQVEVEAGGRTVKAGKEREVLLSPGLVMSKFKSEPNDELSRWSRLRSEYESEASVASAQYVYDRRLAWGYSDWFWNPWFGSWTWLPASGYWMNPYGFGYWSPFAVYNYYPIPYYGYRSFAFRPRTESLSPSGLNLQRGQAARAARSGIVSGPRVAPLGGGRAFGGRPMSMGRGGGRR